jgi:hypothetical protein
MDTIMELVNVLQAQQRYFDSILASQRILHDSVTPSAQAYIDVVKHLEEHVAFFANPVAPEISPLLEMTGLGSPQTQTESAIDFDWPSNLFEEDVDGDDDDDEPPSHPIGFRPHSDP